MEDQHIPGPILVDSNSELDDRYEWAEVTTMDDWPKQRFVVTRIRYSAE